MKKVLRIFAMVIIGIIALSGAGYAGWWLDTDVGQQEKLEQAYKELNAKRYQNISLQARCWNLEDAVFAKSKELAEKERIFERAVAKNKDYYEGRIEQLDTKVKALDEQVELLQKQMVGEVMGEWGGLRDFNSFEELMRFLIEDETDKLKYAEEAMDCDDYTALLIRNAQVKGFRLYPIRWAFIEGQHINPMVHRLCEAIVEETMPDGKTARWLVWIEPQSDEWLKIGLEDEPSSWREKIIPFLP